MIVTDKFVMINFPKTGSAFARKMLQIVHHGSNYSYLDKLLFKLNIVKRPYFEIFEVPNIRDMSHRRNFMDEHGIFIQIPDEHRKKLVLSIKRNIYDRYISIYEFEDWKRDPWLDIDVLKNKFSNYPDLSFEQFMSLILNNNPMELLPEVNRKLPVGPITSQFILFYFREPFKILNSIDEHYIASEDFKKDLADIRFIDQANLNNELFQFLKDLGYKERRIKFILDGQPINKSTPAGKTRDDYFTEELYKEVQSKEKLLFKILDHLKTKDQ
ncbi:MAG: hypothetical protein HKN54_05875 [Flavobacteriaceae bacterium]|nr:hypothetical protein [Flavobacteriaceae bacterium]